MCDKKDFEVCAEDAFARTAAAPDTSLRQMEDHLTSQTMEDRCRDDLPEIRPALLLSD